ncbi:MAG: Coq4 family protein [Bacteroidota bacterium]
MKKIEINYQSETSVRAKVVLWLLEKGVPIHAKLNKSRIAWNLSSIDLLNYSSGSLGNTLGVFYRKEKFEPIPKAERHDVFHILLGYSTHVIDEAAMQFFLWGNGKPSFFTVGSCVVTAILFPNQFHYFRDAYQKGKRSTSIRNWDFKLLLNEDIHELKNRIFTLK